MAEAPGLHAVDFDCEGTLSDEAIEALARALLAALAAEEPEPVSDQ